ncbi:LD-carboxypeptidase [Colletotrichum somersetense]|nr:LD-carboxypeptidase [Colletotrichum somersetense]
MSCFPPPIIPKALRPGAKIAFLSPSGRIDPEVVAPLARAETLLRSLGYTVTNIYSEAGERTSSGGGGGVDPIDASIRNRLAELRAAFADPTVDMIFCTVGGSTMTELIPYIVEDAALHALVRANPKLVVGYSDITVLHWCLRALTGLRTFYGPCAALELGGEVDAAAFTPVSVSAFSPSASVPEDPAEGDVYVHEFQLATLFQAISHPGRPLGPVPRSRFYAPLIPAYFFPPPSPPPTNTRALLPSPAWTWLRPGRAEGRLFGGCLTVVSRIQGIPRISPDWRGRILFLESATGEGDQTKGNPLGRVQQAVADLAARGVFDELAGLVIGRPYGYNTEKERARYAAAFRGLLCHGRLADRRFPILMNVDVSHTSPKVTLPMDALAVLDSDKDEFAITEAAVL